MAKTKETKQIEGAEGNEAAAPSDKPKKERKERAKRPPRVKFGVTKGASDVEKVHQLYKLSIEAGNKGQNPVTKARTRTFLNTELAASGHKVACPDSVIAALIDISNAQMERTANEAARIGASVGTAQMITAAYIREAAERCGQGRFYPRHVVPALTSEE